MFESCECAASIIACGGGGEAFRAQNGDEAWLPLRELGEKSIWGEAGVKTLREELQKTMHDIAEGAYAKAAFRTIKGRRMWERGRYGIGKAIGGRNVEACEWIEG